MRSSFSEIPRNTWIKAFIEARSDSGHIPAMAPSLFMVCSELALYLSEFSQPPSLLSLLAPSRQRRMTAVIDLIISLPRQRQPTPKLSPIKYHDIHIVADGRVLEVTVVQYKTTVWRGCGR
eukprot:IDg6452t1